MSMLRRFAAAFTLIEVLVSITIIAMLASLLFPVYASARDRARQAGCVSNLRQITMALNAYAQDHDWAAPWYNGGCAWPITLRPYAGGEWSVFQCPSHIGEPRSQGARGYTMNSMLIAYQHYQFASIRADQIESGLSFPATTVAFTESADIHHQRDNSTSYPCYTDWPQNAERDLFESGMSFVGGRTGAVRHQGGSNYAFLDGHVKWFKPEQVLPSDVKTGGRSPGFSLE